MNLQYLNEFLVLERIRHYTLAAEELFTTEATLSRHIKALEADLGQPLFRRTTRQVALTEFGQKFLMYAIKIVETMKECEANLLHAPSPDENWLMIGIFGSIESYAKIRKALQLLSKEYPEYVVGTIQGDINEQKEKISSQKYHLAIVRESSDTYDDQFNRLTLIKEPLCVVLSKDNPLSAHETVDISLLKGLSVTVPSKHMLIYRLLLEHCRSCGFEPAVTFLLREGEFAQYFVSTGDGITVMCDKMAKLSFNPATQVIRALSPTIYEYVNLLSAKQFGLPKPVKNAIRCFEKSISEDEAPSDVETR